MKLSDITHQYCLESQHDYQGIKDAKAFISEGKSAFSEFVSKEASYINLYADMVETVLSRHGWQDEDLNTVDMVNDYLYTLKASIDSKKQTLATRDERRYLERCAEYALIVLYDKIHNIW